VDFDEQPGVGDESFDHVPIGSRLSIVAVKVGSDPTSSTNVRRAHIPFRFGSHQGLLHANSRRETHEDAIAVVVIGHRGETLHVVNEPRRLAVTRALTDER